MFEIVLNTVQDYDIAIRELEKARRLCGTKEHKKQACIIQGIKAYKSGKQNRLFHKLLKLYWDSGCCSYLCYEDMRRKFKEIAGLVKVEERLDLITGTGKKILWWCLIKYPFSNKDKAVIIKLLRGRIEKEMSWADATQPNATIAIKRLLEEMDESLVSGSIVGKQYEKLREQLENN